MQINIPCTYFLQTPCCDKFYKCRFCHDENESHHFDRKTLTELICSECNTRQKVQEQCEKCGVRFGKVSVELSFCLREYLLIDAVPSSTLASFAICLMIRISSNIIVMAVAFAALAALTISFTAKCATCVCPCS